MNWIEALILGILQGLTEFLPVSSSGHLEIGRVLLNTEFQENLLFTVVVHGATVLSVFVVFYDDIIQLIRNSATFRYNESTAYILKIGVSMLPVLLVGIFLKEQVSELFNGNLVFIGSMLIITAILLAITRLIKYEKKNSLSFPDALIIGIAQAVAVIPGISRSGATISTGIILGNKKEDVTRFSFLMVLIPIIGANILDLSGYEGSTGNEPGIFVLFTGFTSAFFTGWIACKWMIKLVRKGNLIYFSLYCLLLGISAIIFA